MKVHSFLVVEPGPQTAATYATWTLGAFSASLNATSPLCPQKPAACWDTNHSDKCDLDTEDINGDGACTIADCAGPAGQAGSGGLPGPAGIPGPAGPQGPNGDAAFPSAFRLASVTGASDSAVVSCLAGERLLSGGAVCAVPNRTTNSGRIAASGPSGTNAWMVTCSVGQATAVAVCASALGGN
jgi:hypothetical protein